MARAFQSEAIRGNMADSLARRPAMATGSSPPTVLDEFEGRSKLTGACTIALDRIVSDPDQPRTEWESPEAIEALERLAASLKARGQLQPIRVRWVAEIGRYMVVVGERRWRAASMAGMASVECVIVQGGVSPEDRLEDQLVENALRYDNLPVEQARAYRRLMDARGYTHRELADRLNVDHATVTRALGLLNLPELIQAAVDAREIRPQTAYELSRVKDPTEQAVLAEQAKAGRLKRDDLRQRVASKGRAAGKGKPAKLPTERTVKAPNGIKVTAQARKGFDVLACLEALEYAVQEMRGKLEPTET